MNPQRLLQLAARLGSPWLFAALALFLALYAFLGFSYFQEQARLADLIETKDRLSAIAGRESARERINELEAELQAIRDGIPPSDLQEIDVFSTLSDLALQLGLEHDLELLLETAREKVGDTDYRVLTFSMSVAGEYDRVWELVQMMDNGGTPYKTLVVNKTSLIATNPSNATLYFKIYTRPAGS